MTLKETVSEDNVLTEAYLGSLLDLAGKLYFGQVDVENRLLAEQMDIKYSRTLSVGMMGYLPDGTLFTDIDLDSRIVPGYYENTKEFNLLSGIRSSAYESIVWEQLIGVHSASTISLFREATDCGIPIHLLNEENFDTVSQKLTLSESTMQTVKGHVESSKMVILPETELTMGDWSGTGYMVLDPDTYTGQYMVNGGLTGELNGGVTSEAVDRAMLVNFYMTLEDCVGAITLCCQLLRYIPAGGVVGALAVLAIVALGAYLIYTSIAYYQEAEDLAERYYAGDMAAGEEMINRTAWDVTISIFAWAIGIGSYVNSALARRAGASLTKTVGREAADKLMEGAKVPADLTKHVEKFLELGMTTEAITNLAESLKPVNFEKLGRLARQGMPIELLESLAKNERVLEEFDEVMLLLFKDSELDPDTIIRHLAEEGEDFVSRFVKHGDEVLEGGSNVVATIIKETDTYIDYLNQAGQKIRIPKQNSKAIGNSINSKLQSTNVGEQVEGKVANFIKNDMGIELTDFGNKVKDATGQVIGEIDCATENVLIEVKASIGSVSEEQFIKYTDFNNNKYINVLQKDVVLYIDESMENLSTLNKEKVKTIEAMGVKIVNGLDELKGVFK